jgi:hypothetical protein
MKPSERCEDYHFPLNNQGAAMLTAIEQKEYMEEIRKHVCTRCIERPPDGPPCAPLAKQCGIEMHLPELIDAIHDVRSDLIWPYLKHNRERICEKCILHNHPDLCPCPMDYLAVLLVEAVEAVDKRRASQEQPV